MPRIKILSTTEKNTLESPPLFNSVERRRFFTLPQMLNESMDSFKSPTNKVCFVVTAGYFKAQHRFFARQFHQTDIAYVARQIGVQINDVETSGYDKATYLRHQRVILNYFGFTLFDSVARSFAQHEILIMLRVQFRPKLILLDIMDVLTRKGIALPGYNVLATLIVEAIQEHQHGLNQIIKTGLNKNQQELLDTLLEKVTGSGSGDKWRYQITLLKKISQSTRPSKIKANLSDLQNLLGLYLEFKPVVNQLGLSQECLRYYAYSVVKAQVHQISRREKQDRYLHLIAFIAYQTLKLQDMMIDVLLLAVQSAINATTKEHKEIYYQERENRNQSMSQLVDGLQSEFISTMTVIKAIIADTQLIAEQKVVAIEVAINLPAVKKTGIEQRIEEFKQDLTTLQQSIGYYDLLEKRSLKLQSRVAEIVRQTIFDPNCGKPLLFEAISHYQWRSGSIDKTAPTAFLTPDQRKLLLDQDGKFRVSLYKALLFLAVADAVKSGALNLLHSAKYRSLDDYMIPKQDWDENRDEYLQRAGLTQYSDCQATLKALTQAIDLRYEKTNSHFIAGENPYLTFRSDGTFHVSTPKLEDVESLPLSQIFPERKYISLLEALATVDKATGFLEEFEHWQVKHRQEKPAKKVFFAGIMAYGCDIGHRKLAQISKQINENELDNTLNWYFSLDNVQSANDRIVQFMDKLEIPDIYRNQADQLHTSSDGKKRGVSVDSLNANYSYKYLGKEKGVSEISFIDMRQMTWHSMVISSAEREAAYVIDGLMHNDVIKSDIHSTDTHGYSEVIFASTFFLSFTFAPRIKGVGHQKLYAFRNGKTKTTMQDTQGFKPERYINEEISSAQWDEMLRFIATIKLKKTTASQLFKRLNSYSKQHPLYKALKEFGKIPKTLFILWYADDLEFRQSIEKQLNKVEGSNKLSKAISLGNDQAFIQGEKEDQDIAEGCRRLIKNTLICWNYLYLTKEFGKDNNEERKKELIEAIRNDSVMRWSHFNLQGEYDFSDEKMVDSIGL